MKKQLTLPKKDRKILYLYTGDHPVHRKMAESIGADILPLTWKIPKDYDIYISEGDYVKLSILKLFGKIKQYQKIIVLFSDPRLFYLNFRNKLDFKSQRIKKISLSKVLISKFLIDKLNGAICLSKFEHNLLNKISPKLKSMTHYPFVESELYKKLIKIKPALDKNRVLFIGNGPDWYYKGLDLFLKITSKNPLLEFTIIGGQWDKFLEKNILPPNLKFVGRKNPEQIKKYLERSDLYLHLGRGEAFGVTIAEAMTAGIPCIISDQTGAKEFVERVSPELVVDKNLSKINETLNNYLSLDVNKKLDISKKFKRITRKLEEGETIKEYKIKFNKFIKNL